MLTPACAPSCVVPLTLRPSRLDEMGMKAVAAKAIGENVDYSLLTDPTELAPFA